MINNIKKSIAAWLLKKRLQKQKKEPVNFNKFISSSIDFIILLPDNEKDLHHCLPIMKYLKEQNKNATVVLPEYLFNTIPQKEKYNAILFSENDYNLFNLPNKNICSKLNGISCDVVIDLNRSEELFYPAITNYFESVYRIGFNKNDSDKYYNFQVFNDKINAEISYRNLLNSLQMF